jgi:class 3 adenylate cyclase
MDIASWLRSLGLERYEAAFRENEIDETVLRGLTSEDLKDLGVGTVGQRRKLLDAIAAQHTNAAPDAPPVEVPENAVERRRVTVIFADLVGFTALSVRMDPEDLQSVIGAYHQCVAKRSTASMDSSQVTWVTARWYILVIRRRTRTTRTAPFEPA